MKTKLQNERQASRLVALVLALISVSLVLFFMFGNNVLNLA